MQLADLPLSFQTTYAELLEQCALDSFENDFSAPGTFVSKSIRDRRYWYFQYPATASESQKQKYVGPETPELLDRIKRHRNARSSERNRRALVTALRTTALPRPIPKIGSIVEALAKSGVFRLRGVLVGTVAYQVYPAMLGVRLPSSALQTADVDVAQYENVSVGVQDSTPPMLDVLQDVDPSFRAIPHLHDGRRSSTYEADDKVRVDFLTPNEGKDTDAPKRLKALGTDAEPLRFLGFLISEPEPAILLHGSGIYVSVPSPQRFAVHKLIVAQRRRVGSPKKAKDLLQAAALLQILAQRRPHELAGAWNEAERKSLKWANYLYEGLGNIDAQIRDTVLQLLGKTRDIIPNLRFAFDEAPPARYDLGRDGVSLWAQSGDSRVRCLISRATLDDNFGTDGLDNNGRLRALVDNRDQIERLLRAKYLHRPVEGSELLILKTLEVPELNRLAQLADRRKRASRKKH